MQQIYEQSWRILLHEINFSWVRYAKDEIIHDEQRLKKGILMKTIYACKIKLTAYEIGV